MKQLLVLITLFLFSCAQDFSVHCEPENYIISPIKNPNTGFNNNQREFVTVFSEEELELFFNETTISLKDVLTNFFYCNICLNNDSNYLISYSGKRFDLDNVDSATIVINNLIDLIRSMSMGAEEYEYFLNTQMVQQ